MKISRVDISLVECSEKSRLRAYARIELDNVLTVNHLRVIEAPCKFLIAMPSRERMKKCGSCRAKISFRDKYCSGCGKEQTANLSDVTYEDLVHPVEKCFAEQLNMAVMEEYEYERNNSHDKL